MSSKALKHIVEKKNHVKRNVERTKKKLQRKGKKAQEALIENEVRNLI